ncbi:MAG TPA: YdeI/OmpD-associated family protein [Longimicrobiaceae bacterium]
MEPIFFANPAEFRAWLEEHHESERELHVGYYKKGTGRPSMTWPESVDQALCFGWIDGVRRSLGEEAYTIRFTPRKARSTWSAVNLKRVPELIEAGLMRPAGLRAYKARTEDNSRIYAYEQKEAAALTPEEEAAFRAEAAAWEFFQARPAGYRKTATWWVVSAKKEETRAKRLATLIDDSAHGRTLAQLTRPPKRE